MAAQVHSLLANGKYRVVSDSGSIRDPEGLFVTRRQSIVWRGSEDSLIKAFKIGNTFTSINSAVSSSQSKMMCGGPDSMKLIDYTGGEPHWDVDLTWVGIHKSYSGDADFVYRIEEEGTRVETSFPKTGTLDTGASYTYGVLTPYVSAPPVTANKYKRARIGTFVPIKKIIGVIKTSEPVGFGHSKLFALVKTFGPPDQSLLRGWRPGDAGTGIPEPQWNWFAKYMEGAADSAKGGSWVPSSIQVRRQLSVGDLFVFTMDVPWEQRVTPG